MGSLRVRHDWTTSLSFHFHALEKEMVIHSSVLAWRIPGTGEPGGLLVYGVAQSRTRLKWLSSSSSSSRGINCLITYFVPFLYPYQWEQSYGTEPLICRTWHYLQVDSVRPKLEHIQLLKTGLWWGKELRYVMITSVRSDAFSLKVKWRKE